MPRITRKATGVLLISIVAIVITRLIHYDISFINSNIVGPLTRRMRGIPVFVLTNDVQPKCNKLPIDLLVCSKHNYRPFTVKLQEQLGLQSPIIR